MGDNRQIEPGQAIKKSHFYKKRWFIVLIILIVVAIVGLSSYLFISSQKKSMIQSDQSNSNQSKPLSAKDKIVQISGQLGSAPSKETLSKTQTELTQLTKDATSVDVKQIYLNESFELYVNNNGYEQALAVANQSEQIRSTALTAANIAYVYMGLKDYSKAVQHYQLAADRSDKVDSPTIECPYNDYMASKHLAEALIK